MEDTGVHRTQFCSQVMETGPPPPQVWTKGESNCHFPQGAVQGFTEYQREEEAGGLLGPA